MSSPRVVEGWAKAEHWVPGMAGLTGELIGCRRWDHSRLVGNAVKRYGTHSVARNVGRRLCNLGPLRFAGTVTRGGPLFDDERRAELGPPGKPGHLGPRMLGVCTPGQRTFAASVHTYVLDQIASKPA